MPTAVLASSIVALYAVDLPIGVEISALIMVGAILKVFLKRDDSRFERLEKDVKALRKENLEQRHLKHDFRTQLTTVLYALHLTLGEAEKCKCGAFDTLRPVLQQILEREEERLK